MPPPEGRGIAKHAGRSAGHTRGQTGDGLEAAFLGRATVGVGAGRQVVGVRTQVHHVEHLLAALVATVDDRRLREIGRDCVASANDLQVLTARRTHDVRRGAEQVRILLGQVAGAGAGNLDELRQATLLRLVGVEQTGRHALGLQTDGVERRVDAHRLTGACRFCPVVAAGDRVPFGADLAAELG